MVRQGTNWLRERREKQHGFTLSTWDGLSIDQEDEVSACSCLLSAYPLLVYFNRETNGIFCTAVAAVTRFILLSTYLSFRGKFPLISCLIVCGSLVHFIGRQDRVWPTVTTRLQMHLDPHPASFISSCVALGKLRTSLNLLSLRPHPHPRL